MNEMNEQRRRFLARAGQGMVWLSAAPLVACGGGGGGGGDPGSGTAGTPVDTALRASTLASVRSAVAGLAAGAAAFDSTALARALQALPALERVGISTTLGNVWAKFTDGQFLVVPNNLDPATRATGRGAIEAQRQALGVARQATKAPARERAAANGDLDTPAILTGQQYRQLDMLGQVPVSASPDAAHLSQDFVSDATLPNLRKMAVGRGFTLPAVPTIDPPDVGIDNGIDGLSAIGGDGIFFITACAAQVGNDDNPRTVICTATRATEANLARHAADLASGVLVHAVTMRGVSGAWEPVDCLAIGPEFVRLRGWTFPTECIGIFNLSGGARLSDWIAPLNAAGLNHILGWEQAVSWQRLLAFADDLIQLNLATNNFDGNVAQDREPKLRAYGMGETLSYLVQRGIAAGGSPFYLQENTPTLFVNTLLPTIDLAIFREADLEFELVGQFGRRADVEGVLPRIVISTAEGGSFAEPLLSRAADAPLGGNQSLRDPTWEGGLLQTVLDKTDLERGGYVQVFNGGRCSNVLPITHWEIPFHVVTTIDALTLDITVTIRLRADVHGWRLTPDGEPRVGATLGNLGASVLSRASFTASGQIVRDDAENRTRTTISWSGTGSVGNEFRAFAVNLVAFLDWNSRRTTIATLSATLGPLTQTKLVERFDINGEILSSTTTTEQVPVDATVAGPGLQGVFEFGFDERWALLAGQFDMQPVNASLLPAPPQLVRRTRVIWPQVQPDFPPRQDYGGT